MARVASTAFIWLVASVTGCAFEPDGAQPVDPPVAYREWWSRTEACSGLAGDVTRIDWSVVPGEDFECPTGRCVGRWERGHHIYLAEAWAANELVVRHEMLHDLMGHPGHPNPPFGSGCPLTWETWPGPRHAMDRLGPLVD